MSNEEKNHEKKPVESIKNSNEKTEKHIKNPYYKMRARGFRYVSTWIPESIYEKLIKMCNEEGCLFPSAKVREIIMNAVQKYDVQETEKKLFEFKFKEKKEVD